MEKSMIGITGATGQVGQEFVKLLVAQNIEAKLLVRNLEKAQGLFNNPSRIEHLDFDLPSTYAKALTGVDKLFLICYRPKEDLLRAFLAEAKKQGVHRIVVMSGMGADKSRSHFLGRLEELVQATGIPSVSLRANWFMQNFGTMFHDMITRDKCLRFADGQAKLSFVDARDVAEVALHCLLNRDLAANFEAFDITGPESLSHKEVAQLFSEHLSYEIDYRELSEEEACKQLGWDENILNLFRDIRKGYTTPTSEAVNSLLQKPARNFRDYVKENRQVWLSQKTGSGANK